MMVQSKIGQLGLKEIMDPTTWHHAYCLCASWMNHNPPIKIERAIYGNRGIVVHDHRAIVTVDWSSPNRTVRDFH